MGKLKDRKIAMNFKSEVYRALRISNDINAVVKGKAVKRIQRRVLGKIFGKIIRLLVR